MKDDVESNRVSSEQLEGEDTGELAANLLMYHKPVHEKDPLDSSTTAQFALEPTPIFQQTVAARGYNPQKDDYDRKALEFVPFDEMKLPSKELVLVRKQPRRPKRRDRRGRRSR